MPTLLMVLWCPLAATIAERACVASTLLVATIVEHAPVAITLLVTTVADYASVYSSVSMTLLPASWFHISYEGRGGADAIGSFKHVRVSCDTRTTPFLQMHTHDGNGFTSSLPGWLSLLVPTFHGPIAFFIAKVCLEVSTSHDKLMLWLLSWRSTFVVDLRIERERAC